MPPIRLIAALAAPLLLGCLDDGEGYPDATPDANPATAPDAAWPTSPLGTWRITWDFDGWDIQGRNPIPTDTVTITEIRALYEGCLECGAAHAGKVDGACFSVPAGEDRGRPRDAYQLCVEGPELVGVIHWEPLFESEVDQVWTVTGEPVEP
jgi:hypothetical protein